MSHTLSVYQCVKSPNWVLLCHVKSSADYFSGWRWCLCQSLQHDNKFTCGTVDQQGSDRSLFLWQRYCFIKLWGRPKKNKDKIRNRDCGIALNTIRHLLPTQCQKNVFLILLRLALIPQMITQKHSDIKTALAQHIMDINSWFITLKCFIKTFIVFNFFMRKGEKISCYSLINVKNWGQKANQLGERTKTISLQKS